MPHNTIDGSSSTFPFKCEKFIAGAVESASALTLQDPDISSSEEFPDTTSSEESTVSSSQTVLHNTTDGSTPSAPSLGSKILIRRPPNLHQVFYIRMDCGGSCWMYPDLGGPFQSLKEAEDAISHYLNELRRQARCKEQDGLSLVDKMIYDYKYYLDGTPKRGPNSPSSSVDEKYNLVQALLDQYNEYHNLFEQWLYEDQDHRWYYHFNFTTKKKKADGRSSRNLFFAEVSNMKGEHAWEVNCRRMIENDDSGPCYGCRNNGSPGMRHPNNTDAYTSGHLDGYLPFGCESSSSDEGRGDPHYWKRLMSLTKARVVKD